MRNNSQLEFRDISTQHAQSMAGCFLYAKLPNPELTETQTHATKDLRADKQLLTAIANQQLTRRLHFELDKTQKGPTRPLVKTFAT